MTFIIESVVQSVNILRKKMQIQLMQEQKANIVYVTRTKWNLYFVSH